MEPGDKAFVTGGSGFIGGRLIEKLVERGVEVRALARSDKAAAAIEAKGATPVRGDLEDKAAMTDGARGCRYAFHAAAALGDGGKKYFERINVTGTQNVLDATKAAGVERFVHVGTEAALLAGDPLVHADESAPLRPDSKAIYPSTKAKAERLVRAANSDGFATVVVRPRFVWGPGDQTVLPTLKEMVETGKFAWVGGGRHLTETTHVDNVIHGLILGAEKGEPGAAYFVHDGEPVVFRDFVTDLLATQNTKPGDRSVPNPIAGAVTAIGEALWRFLPLPGEPPLTYMSYWVSGHECTLDITRAREDLGYEPVVTRAEGLAGLRA